MIQDICFTSAAGSAETTADRFSELRERHAPQLKRLASHAAQPPFSARELVREGEYALWRASLKFTGDVWEEADGFSAFAEKVVRNHLCRIKRDFFRRDIARARLEKEGYDRHPSQANEELDRRVRVETQNRDFDFDSPEVFEIKREAQDEILRAISALGGRQRSIIEARYFLQETLLEAGKRVNLTPQAASVYESRALARLRSILNPDLVETIYHGRN